MFFITKLINIINNPIFKIALLYNTSIIAHYIAAHLYIYFCVPLSFIGFLISPFMALTPHCQAFRWIIYNGGVIINMMWFLIGNWLLNIFNNLFTPNNVNNVKYCK
jgi:hypothetical protein